MNAKDSLLGWVCEAEGFFLYPQAFFFVLCCSQILYCWLLLRRRSCCSIETKFSNLRGVGVKGWASILGRTECALGKCLTGIAGDALSPEQVRVRLGEFFGKMEVVADRSLRMLGVFAQVAMLLGLLGTVVGLVMSFTVISQYEQTPPPPSELALGVSRALSTTIFGLTTAIPAFLGHAWLQGRADHMLHQLSVDLEAIVPEVRGRE